jgi:UDP-N-acetylglucosamine 2-epimerase
MVTTEMAVAGSTVVEAMAAVATVVGEEAISRSTTPDRFAEKRFTEMLTHRESSILP